MNNYFTVVRFFAEHDDQIKPLCTELNALDPSLAAKEDRGAKKRISCAISRRSSDWFSQYRAVVDFLRRGGDLIERWRGRGVEVQFDVAIYAQETSVIEVDSVVIDEPLAEQLVRHQVSLLFSLYTGRRGDWWRWTLQRLLKAPLFLTAFHVLGRVRDRIT